MPVLRERPLPELGAAGLTHTAGGFARPVLDPPAGGKGGEGDFVRRLREEAERRREAAAGGLSAALMDGSALAGLASGAPLSATGRALAEAERCVREEKHAEALAHLDVLLREDPDHPEGTYLRGYCLWKLERPEDALRALLPLRRARPGGTLAARLAALTGEIRGRLSLAVLLTCMVLLEGGRADEAAARLSKAVELDPEAGLYHCLLAQALAVAGRFDEAAAAVENGVGWCPAGPDREMLRGAADEIDRRRLLHLLEPARDRYRAGNYPRARAALRRVPPPLQRHPLYRAFHGYLDALGGGLFGLVAGRTPADVAPPGDFATVDALHFFLAGEEIGRARALLEGDDPARAGPVLARALELAPTFPYAHHLMAACCYQGAAELVQRGAVNEALARLDRARRHAGLAACDPEITGNAGLLEAIDAARRTADEIRRELDTRREEADRVNALIRDYNAALELTGDGIGSTAHLERVSAALDDVRRRLAGEATAARTPPAQEALRSLGEAVDRRRAELDGLRAGVREAEEVREVMQRFTDLVEGARRGIATRADFDRARGGLTRLRADARTLRRRVKDEDGGRVLDQLLDAVERNLGQLDEASFGDAQAVNAQGEEFRELMEGVAGGVRSHDQLRRLAGALRALRGRAQALRQTLPDGAGRKALDALLGAIDRVLRQAGEHL